MGSQGWIVITEVEEDLQVRPRTSSTDPEATLFPSLSGNESECECQDNPCFPSHTDVFKFLKNIF